MMEVPIDWVLVIPLATSLALLLIGAVFYSLRAAEPRRGAARVFIYRCSACGRIYLDHRERPMAACPRCGNLNAPARR